MSLNFLNVRKLQTASRLISRSEHTVLFVTSLLRAREMKMASALRKIGWNVVLIYLQTTPFKPDGQFDVAIRARTEAEAHEMATMLSPRLVHVFSGAVDGLLLRFCRQKPAPVVIDLNDVFCSALFDYCHERFEPTRECMERATGLCARDLQANFAERIDGFQLPQHKILFPEYAARNGAHERLAAEKAKSDDVRVVSVGTFCLEKLGMYDSAYLQLARMITEQGVHFHIYPHWFYLKSRHSAFNMSMKRDFSDFLRLQEKTEFFHLHDSLPFDELAEELPRYDFGIVAGGSPALGQRLQLLKPAYMASCYSGRISDYLEAGLPVLINREVGFNHWLLKRYGLMVELERVLRPGFRDYLLNIKRDPVRRQETQQAAETLSVGRNIERLAAFYERIMREDRTPRLKLGIRWAVAKQLPWVGETARVAEAEFRTMGQALGDEAYELLRASEARTRVMTVLLRLRAEKSRAPQLADRMSGLLNWPEIRNFAQQTSGMGELIEMFDLLVRGKGPLNEFSSCWEVLAFKNVNQLLSDGYRNFKRTIGCNYFNFLVQKGDPQIQFLESQLDRDEVARWQRLARELPPDPSFEWHDQTSYRYFVMLLWAYAKKIDKKGVLARLEEPAEGNPVVVPADGAHASQDLANSVLEYYSMADGVDLERCRRVLEIGGGYGRNAYVMLKLHPNIQYVMVDVPPALWVAQRYLSSVFPDRSVFRVRHFESYDDVRREMEWSNIVFLLPHQLPLLPPRSFDLSLNISSFGEMMPGQINAYFQYLARLTEGHFYTKQWKVAQNAFDRVKLTEDDYPVPGNWVKVYSRTCAVQTAFFESLYETGRTA